MPAPSSLGEAIVWIFVAILMLIVVCVVAVVGSPIMLYNYIKKLK